MFKFVKKMFGQPVGEGAEEEIAAEEGAVEAPPAAAPAASTPPPPDEIVLPKLKVPSYEWRFTEGEDQLPISGAANLALANHIVNDAFAAMRMDLALAERILGADSPRLLDILTMLTRTAGAEGVDSAAHAYADRAIVIAEATGNMNKKSDAIMRRAELLLDRGNLAEATNMFEESLAVRREALGDEHKHVQLLADYVARLQSGEVQPRNKEQIYSAFDEMIEMARATMPSRRMYMAEAYAREALNIASELGGFSEQSLTALSLLGEILLSAQRPIAALPFLLHACDVVYVREGEESDKLPPLLAMLREAQEQAPHGDYDPEGGCGVMTVARSDLALHYWIIPHLFGRETYGNDLPPGRPLWNTIDVSFVTNRLRDSGWLDSNPAAEAAFVSYAIDADGKAHDIRIEQSSGNAELDAGLLERMAKLHFNRASAGDQRYVQEVWFFQQPLNMPGPEAGLIENTCIVLQASTVDEGGDLWVLPCA